MTLQIPCANMAGNEGKMNRNFTHFYKSQPVLKGELMNENRIKQMLIDCLADSPTALICNAYDFMGMHSPCTDWSVFSMTSEFPPMVGEAITIKLDCSSPSGDNRYEAEDDGRGKSHWQMLLERMEQSEVPQVVVIESLGEKRKGAVLGDGMSKTILSLGGAGCVTDGGVRDIADIKRAGMKLFGGGYVVNHTALRWSGLGEPVSIGGLQIKTGDMVHGDTDGVIVMPQEGWGKVVRACRYVLDFEKAAHVESRRTDIDVAQKNVRIGELVSEYKQLIEAITDWEI